MLTVVTLKVRPARPDELPLVQEMNVALFAGDAVHDPHLVMTWPVDDETGAPYFRDRIAGKGVCFVCELDDEVAGYLAGALQPIESYRRGSRAELENMFVKPDV